MRRRCAHAESSYTDQDAWKVFDYGVGHNELLRVSLCLCISTSGVVWRASGPKAPSDLYLLSTNAMAKANAM